MSFALFAVAYPASILFVLRGADPAFLYSVASRDRLRTGSRFDSSSRHEHFTAKLLQLFVHNYPRRRSLTSSSPQTDPDCMLIA